MERVTSTKQLKRGQTVVVVEDGSVIRLNYYRFIGEDLSSIPNLRESYGYFADFSDQPERIFLSEAATKKVYTNYTCKEIALLKKELLQKALRKLKKSLEKISEDEKKTFRANNEMSNKAE